jgi:tetratricopeptide (TPR) repeat protein
MAESASELHAEIEKLERRHAEHPEGRYFVPLANAYRKLGEVGRAERLLHEGLRHHPDYLSAHIVLGRCLADRNAVADAAQEFRYVLTLDSQNLIALRTLGELAAGQGHTEEAERWYEQLLAVDPMNEEARRALESLRGLAGDDAEFDAGSGWWERQVEAPAPPEPAPAEPAPAPTAAEPPADPEPHAAAESEPMQEEEPDWQDLLVRDEPFDEPPAPADEEVVTETIAELYARQGFPERAAEVFRTLIRQRGGDPTLELRLAELETGAAARVPEGAAPPPPSAAEPGGVASIGPSSGKAAPSPARFARL